MPSSCALQNFQKYHWFGFCFLNQIVKDYPLEIVLGSYVIRLEIVLGFYVIRLEIVLGSYVKSLKSFNIIVMYYLNINKMSCFYLFIYVEMLARYTGLQEVCDRKMAVFPCRGVGRLRPPREAETYQIGFKGMALT